jgi:hypothetical protein
MARNSQMHFFGSDVYHVNYHIHVHVGADEAFLLLGWTMVILSLFMSLYHLHYMFLPAQISSLQG